MVVAVEESYDVSGRKALEELKNILRGFFLRKRNTVSKSSRYLVR